MAMYGIEFFVLLTYYIEENFYCSCKINSHVSKPVVKKLVLLQDVKHDIPEKENLKGKHKNGGSVNSIGDNNNSGLKDDEGVRLRSRKSLRKE